MQGLFENPAATTTPSGRACSPGTAARARKRISRNWGFEFKLDRQNVCPVF